VNYSFPRNCSALSQQHFTKYQFDLSIYLRFGQKFDPAGCSKVFQDDPSSSNFPIFASTVDSRYQPQIPFEGLFLSAMHLSGDFLYLD